MPVHGEVSSASGRPGVGCPDLDRVDLDRVDLTWQGSGSTHTGRHAWRRDPMGRMDTLVGKRRHHAICPSGETQPTQTADDGDGGSGVSD